MSLLNEKIFYRYGPECVPPLLTLYFHAHFQSFNKRLWKSCRSWCDNQYIKYTALLFPFSNGRGCFLLSRLESKHTTRFDSMVFVMQHSGALKANTHGNPKKKNKHTSNSMSSGNLTYGKQTLQVLTWLRLLNCSKEIAGWIRCNNIRLIRITIYECLATERR